MKHFLNKLEETLGAIKKAGETRDNYKDHVITTNPFPDLISEEEWQLLFTHTPETIELLPRRLTVCSIEHEGFYICRTYSSRTFFITTEDPQRSADPVTRDRPYSFTVHDKSWELYDYARDVFGEDRVAFYYGNHGSTCPIGYDYSGPVIIFNDIDCYNENNLGIHIPKMYIYLGVSQAGNIYFTGARGEASNIEYENEFGHSHLSSRTHQWGEFCIGSGNMSMALDLVYDDWNEDNIFNLLFTIESFLSWEDLGGGPHRYIQELLKYKETDYLNHAQLLQKIKENPDSLLITYDDDRYMLDIDISKLSDNSDDLLYCYDTHTIVPESEMMRDYSGSTRVSNRKFIGTKIFDYKTSHYFPFLLDKLEKSNTASVNVNDVAKRMALGELNSKLFNIVEHDYKEPEQKVQTTLFGIKEISRNSSSNYF